MCNNCKTTKAVNTANLLNNDNIVIKEEQDYIALKTVITSVANKGRKCNTNELNEMLRLYKKITGTNTELNVSRMENIFKLYNSLTLILMNNKTTDFSASFITEEVPEEIIFPEEIIKKEEVDYKSKFGLTNDKLKKINKNFKKQ